MANSTFSGPIRSEGGFKQIEIIEGTGAVTTKFTVSTDGGITSSGSITAKGNLNIDGTIITELTPSLTGLSATAKATATNVTYVAGINVNPFTGAAAQTSLLPAATVGVVVVHAQSVDTTGGTATLTFNCAGTDVWETGSVIESRGSSAVTFDSSTVGETNLVYTPANAATNLFSIGSYIYFTCVKEGEWTINYDFNPMETGVTGGFAFAA